jgi:hypothetical protein
VVVALALAGLAGPVPEARAWEDQPEARALLQAGEQQLRPGAAVAVSRVLIVRADWQRVLRFRSHDDRVHDRFRLEVLDPAKVRGTLFLKVGGALSMYLPKLKRSIAISPVMLQDPWMGSDFNNQDLVDAGTLLDGYRHRIVARDRQADGELVRIESMPREGAPLAWARLVQRVRANGVPVELEYQDARGRAVRRLTFHDVRDLGGRQVPTRWVMEPLERPGERTEIQIEEIAFGAPIPDSLFETPTAPAPP